MEFAELIITPKLDGITLHTPFHPPVEAVLCITGHHLIVSSRKDEVQEIWVCFLFCIMLELLKH